MAVMKSLRNMAFAPAAAVAATMMAVPAGSPALAQDAQTAAQTSQISYTRDAGLEATRWSRHNPNAAAVGVIMGTSTQLTPTQIENVLRQDFASNGVHNVRFFYEQNDTPGTGFTLHQGGHTYGIYRLENVRENVPMVARQIVLDNHLASNQR